MGDNLPDTIGSFIKEWVIVLIAPFILALSLGILVFLHSNIKDYCPYFGGLFFLGFLPLPLHLWFCFLPT